MITVGKLAERYGMLPHEVAEKATTYDIMITDVLAAYTQYQHQKAHGSVDPSLYDFSANEMLQMMEKARAK